MSCSLALKYSCWTFSGMPHSLATVKRVATCTAAQPFSRKSTASLPVKTPPAAITGISSCSAFNGATISATMVCKIIFRPIQSEAQMSARQRAFHHDVIGQAIESGCLAHEQLQGAQRGDDDAQFGVAEARVIFHQRE